MAEVTVEVGGRSYRLGCGEGQERHLIALATRVDGEAEHLSRMGRMAEGQLMLMSAIMLADKLSTAEQAAAAAERRAAEAERRAAMAEAETERRVAEAEAEADAGRIAPEREGEIAAGLESLANRIENMAAQLDGG